MTEQNTPGQDWKEQEIGELGAKTEGVFEKLPALKFEENKVTELTLDLSQKPDTYDTVDQKSNPVKKAILKVLCNGQKMNWWLNKKNPIYREILELGKGKANLMLKIMQVGKGATTKYLIVK